MSHRHEMNEILKQVEDWPPEERRALAIELLSLVPSLPTTTAAGQRRRSLGELRGIANPTGRTFTDEEIDDLRFQALREKYKL